jgi:pyruvate dehydrogenase E1 component alpha subunit
MSDPAKYRPKGELEEKKKSDPLVITAARLQEDFGVEDDVLAQIKTEVDAEAQAAWDFAESSPEPDPKTLYDFTYAPQQTSMSVGEDAPVHTLDDSVQEAG